MNEKGQGPDLHPTRGEQIIKFPEVPEHSAISEVNRDFNQISQCCWEAEIFLNILLIVLLCLFSPPRVYCEKGGQGSC